MSSMGRTSIALAVFLATSAAPAAVTPDWMVGCWAGDLGKDRVEERWVRPNDAAMFGVSVTTGAGAVRAFEFLRIAVQDGKVVYIAQPGGRTPTIFTAAEPGTKEIVFANPEHDYPKRVGYRLRDDGSLLAWIDGGEAAPEKRVEYPMLRVACEGATAAADAGALAKDPRVERALNLAWRWLEAQSAYDRLTGVSAALVHDQEVLWSGGFGMADPERKAPAGADTIYSICSISKLFTSVAVMRERDLGHLALSDPVAKHLPWFKLSKTLGEGDVTIEGLLTHASGLMRESDFPYWMAPFDFPTREQVMARLEEQPALYEPEHTFQYSNLGLALAGEVVAAASKSPFDDYVMSNILKPLAMTSTTTEMPTAERGKRLAVGYTHLDRDGKRKPLPFFTGDGIGPAMSFASTVTDLARFASWQFRLLGKGGTEVIQATTLREMQRVHWAEPPSWEPTWGLGFEVRSRDGKVFVGHGGSCPGYLSNLLLEPAGKVASVVATNSQGMQIGAYASALYGLVGPAVADAAKSPTGGKATDSDLLRYTGTYDQTPWSGEALIVPWEDGLAIIDFPTLEPAKNLVKLKKTGEHTFRVLSKEGKEREPIVFEVGPDGKATKFWQHSLPFPRVK